MKHQRINSSALRYPFPLCYVGKKLGLMALTILAVSLTTDAGPGYTGRYKKTYAPDLPPIPENSAFPNDRLNTLQQEWDQPTEVEPESKLRRTSSLKVPPTAKTTQPHKLYRSRSSPPIGERTMSGGGDTNDPLHNNDQQTEPDKRRRKKSGLSRPAIAAVAFGSSAVAIGGATGASIVIANHLGSLVNTTTPPKPTPESLLPPRVGGYA
uniref:AlNc14C212G8942 protein n=1 Tax=Albugo laibachii Nc14 TaxID=890382 RepID=F0WRD7_9STRA|nr:AlNc14C212G8942 [Albugo laibachii Nc14]|eukprot:CCA23900.1 AlNc14C212G8942 [Albugo laibachii Nc14]